MQIGMIGLGRMGANMVRRLLRGGHECVVYDRNPEAVKALGSRRRNRRRVARRFYRETEATARDLADDSGRARRYHDSTNFSQSLTQTTSSSTAATPITSTTSAARANSKPKAFIMLTSERVAVFGDSSVVTAR